MSYSIDLAFKEVKDGDEVFQIIQKVKKIVLEHSEEIIKNNVAFSPFGARYRYKEGITENELIDKTEEWLQRLFTYKFIYFPERGLLACVATEKEFLGEVFTNFTFFQNSCDQDYEYETWKGIKQFEEISDKIVKIPFTEEGKKELKKLVLGYKPCYDTEEELDERYKNQKNFEYGKRSLVYKMIFDPIEDTVFGDGENVLYVKCLTRWGDTYTLALRTQRIAQEWEKELLEKVKKIEKNS